MHKATEASLGVVLILFSCFIELRAQAVISVEMEKTVAVSTSHHFGINISVGSNPSVASDTLYKKRIIEIGSKFIRYHTWGSISQKSPQCWIDYANKDWDINRVSLVMKHSPDNAEILINIPGWPSWMDQNNDDKLDEDRVDEYAMLCANLVEIVNNKLKKRVQYWEPINEWDSKYTGIDGIQFVTRVFKKCYDAMKEKDPSIKIGGAVLTHPFDSLVNTTFFANIEGKLDFWSHHNYGGCNEPDISIIYDSANIHRGAKHIRKFLDDNGFQKLPIWINETNIDWGWDCSKNNRMTSEVGAVFDALLAKRAIESGVVDGINVWNDAEGVYGKILTDFSDLHQGGHLLKFLNQFGVGEVKSTTSSQPDRIEGFTVQQTNGRVMFILINKNSPTSVKLRAHNWLPSILRGQKLQKKIISSAGLIETEVTWKEAQRHQNMGANSINIFITEPPQK